MTVTPRTFATILAAAAVLVGLLLLFLPLSTSVNGNAIRCGSAVVASQHDVDGSVLAAAAARIPLGEQIAPIAQAEAACASVRAGRETGGWLLVGAGVVVLAGTRFVRWSPAVTGRT